MPRKSPPPAVRSRPPHPRRAEAVALLLQGQRITQVSAAVGVSWSTIQLWRKALDLPPRRHPGRDEAEALMRQGRTIEEVARAVGASQRCVGRRRPRSVEERPEPLPVRPRKADQALASLKEASRLRAMGLRRELGLLPAAGPVPAPTAEPSFSTS